MTTFVARIEYEARDIYDAKGLVIDRLCVGDRLLSIEPGPQKMLPMMEYIAKYGPPSNEGKR